MKRPYAIICALSVLIVAIVIFIEFNAETSQNAAQRHQDMYNEYLERVNN